MKTLQTTKEFDAWLLSLRDSVAKERISKRLVRLVHGNWGDYKSVGGGVIELRIHAGPGYRIYLTQRRGELILLLAGGTKKTQSADIMRAILLAKLFE